MKPPAFKKKIAPPSIVLPRGDFVKVARSKLGGFEIVTNFLGFVVGSRLDKGKGVYPKRETHCLSLEEAKLSMIEWDKFVSENQKGKK